MSKLQLPRPLAHQRGPLLEDARFKLWPWGRRTGKSRGGLIAGTAGHGPGSTWDAGHSPKYPGVLQGGDVIWVAKDYPQSLAIWQEELRPRFSGLPGVSLNEQRHEIRIEGAGTLLLWSAESIDGLRGRGKNVVGVVLDEPGHWDLEYAWRNVLLPILLDNNGWSIFGSSPNAGYDGNKERVTPSYFNRICLETIDGVRGPEWTSCTLTAEDNPAIGADAFRQLVAEYPANSPELQQEVYAKFITGGSGLAFPEWDERAHVAQSAFTQGWRWFGGLDWGYASRAAFVLVASGPDRELLIRKEYVCSKRTPFDAGCSVGAMLRNPELGLPEFIAADSSMYGPNDGAEKQHEAFERGLRHILGPAAPPLIPAPKYAGSRVDGKMLIHQGLRWEPAHRKLDGSVEPYHLPRLRVHKDCVYLLSTLPRLPLDPKNPEDVDTESDDHGFDALRYALQMRAPETDRPRRDVPEHVHPGYDDTGKRLPRWAKAFEDTSENQGFQVGIGSFRVGFGE